MNFENEADELVKELIKKTGCVALFFVIPVLFIGEFTSVIGMLYGLSISFLLFKLKYIHISKALDMEAARAANYIRNNYFINYGIYFIVLLTAYKSPKLNFLAVVLAIFMLKFVIIGLTVIDVIRENWRKKMKSFQEGRS